MNLPRSAERTNRALKYPLPPAVHAVGAYWLRDHLLEHVGADVGEPANAASVMVGQVLVVEPQEVEEGCMHVADGDGFIGRTEAVVVGRAYRGAAFHIAARHPHAEGVAVVVASDVVADGPVDK